MLCLAWSASVFHSEYNRYQTSNVSQLLGRTRTPFIYFTYSENLYRFRSEACTVYSVSFFFGRPVYSVVKKDYNVDLIHFNYCVCLSFFYNFASLWVVATPLQLYVWTWRISRTYSRTVWMTFLSCIRYDTIRYDKSLTWTECGQRNLTKYKKLKRRK